MLLRSVWFGECFFGNRLMNMDIVCLGELCGNVSSRPVGRRMSWYIPLVDKDSVHRCLGTRWQCFFAVCGLANVLVHPPCGQGLRPSVPRNAAATFLRGMWVSEFFWAIN
jgi:hypothetical protein